MSRGMIGKYCVNITVASIDSHLGIFIHHLYARNFNDIMARMLLLTITVVYVALGASL